MDDIDKEFERKAQIIDFCRELFKTSNLIYSDFEDVNVIKVKRKFSQDRGGVHVQFSVSWHLIGKANPKTQETIHLLLPDDEY
ncbi:MAG: hypothetical protein F4X29_03690 [Rhodothermaceae bacterium]|nr:hypothetical protein [Rhodothermaceae bacterium]